MHQSIPAAPSPSHPGLLRDICPPCESGGWGICNFCAARGPGICQPRGQPRAFEEKYKDNNVTMLPWIRRSRGKNLLLAILIYTLQVFDFRLCLRHLCFSRSKWDVVTENQAEPLWPALKVGFLLNGCLKAQEECGSKESLLSRFGSHAVQCLDLYNIASKLSMPVDDTLVVPITLFAGVNPVILSKIKSIECTPSDVSKRLYKSPMQ